MPELPEVEHLRRSLAPAIVGARVLAVTVRRRSVIDRGSASFDDALLVGRTIVATHRRGKQLALESDDGRALVIQLGMTGSVTLEHGTPPRGMDARHRHVLWDLLPSAASGDPSPAHRWRMAFRDPRRFGGLTAYASLDELERAWTVLGPDALTLTARELADALRDSRRPVKSALLDQGVTAGVGNIYADESLFAARIHPLRPAGSLGRDESTRLAGHIRRILRRAADRGGSTLRDYRDAFGQPGSAVQTHQVYGRAGEPCVACRRPLEAMQLGGRTTVFCPACQHLST
ncbi:MAG: formamidopyrimidine-DNA glycosylase/DNA-(apurinic or apyrimidinic site) lyase [Planctomycetota bacterium]